MQTGGEKTGLCLLLSKFVLYPTFSFSVFGEDLGRRLLGRFKGASDLIPQFPVMSDRIPSVWLWVLHAAFCAIVFF